MSSTQQIFRPIHIIFRLSPLMAAIAVFMSPVTTLQAGEHATKDLQSIQAQAQIPSYSFHQDHILGTSLDVVVTTAHQQDAEKVLQAIQTEVARLDQILSVWRDDSEISQLNHEQHIEASSELYEVIAACEQWRSATCGGFDARLGQLIQLWEHSNQVQNLDDQTQEALLRQLKAQSIELNPKTKQIKMGSAIKIAPDAYAKGYVIDRALIAAQKAVPHVQGILIDIGGDMRVWGQSPQQAGWKVGIQNPDERFDNAAPAQVLNIKDQAVALSGQGYRSLSGQSHLLNPQTGMPIQTVEQCVVVGQCAADADALATALTAMPPYEGMQLIEQLVGFEAQLVASDGTSYQSTGWSTLLDANQAAVMRHIAGNAAATAWPKGFQAQVEVNIPKLAVENYRAPYVSVWVTDSDKKLVRTLAVWGKDEKWINSNYVWWRRYGRQMPNLDAVAKPSRQPGQYRLAWDGKDEAGKMVDTGKYLIHIETSREHGDHSYQSFELEVGPKAVSKTLPAQAEIGTLKLNFQRGA
ncbi:hypothetical protein F889_02285 [Acinetobacter colistiniresistens]|uniref:FAD:protein FMN transferase n=1 Tax=Acinetobacter colistiniresistens TaxID=280145 RepID=N9R3A1_9GAMM|nr:DUF2271 domain-containing protein [Acinetobacter colistiniresistens]ENX33622.1 hypothetical protein F889_02285 [Acinetobacter colistiniresistens]